MFVILHRAIKNTRIYEMGGLKEIFNHKDFIRNIEIAENRVAEAIKRRSTHPKPKYAAESQFYQSAKATAIIME